MQFPVGPRLGKRVPFRAGIPGCIFRKRPVWETISRFEPEFWDAVSPRGLIGKRYPGIRPDGGMRFPNDPSGTEENGSVWAVLALRFKTDVVRPMSSLVAFLPDGELGVFRVPMDIANVVAHARRISCFEQLKNMSMFVVGFIEQFASRLLVDSLVIALDKATLELRDHIAQTVVAAAVEVRKVKVSLNIVVLTDETALDREVHGADEKFKLRNVIVG